MNDYARFIQRGKGFGDRFRSALLELENALFKVSTACFGVGCCCGRIAEQVMQMIDAIALPIIEQSNLLEQAKFFELEREFKVAPGDEHTGHGSTTALECTKFPSASLYQVRDAPARSPWTLVSTT